MNAPIAISEDTYRKGDRQFLRQLKTANRQQLKSMLVVFERLGGPFDWRRAACERRLGVNRTEFPWLEREEWWLQP